MKIIERLKSPVVITQILTIIGALVVVILPEFDGVVEQVVGALAILVSVFAGLNNPADPDNF